MRMMERPLDGGGGSASAAAVAVVLGVPVTGGMGVVPTCCCCCCNCGRRLESPPRPRLAKEIPPPLPTVAGRGGGITGVVTGCGVGVAAGGVGVALLAAADNMPDCLNRARRAAGSVARGFAGCAAGTVVVIWGGVGRTGAATGGTGRGIERGWGVADADGGAGGGAWFRIPLSSVARAPWPSKLSMERAGAAAGDTGIGETTGVGVCWGSITGGVGAAAAAAYGAAAYGAAAAAAAGY